MILREEKEDYSGGIEILSKWKFLFFKRILLSSIDLSTMRIISRRMKKEKAYALVRIRTRLFFPLVHFIMIYKRKKKKFHLNDLGEDKRKLVCINVRRSSFNWITDSRRVQFS